MVGGQEDLSPRIDMELGKGRRKEGTAAAKGVAALCRGNDHPQGSPVSRDTAQHRHILNHGPAGWIFLRDLGWGGVGGRSFSKRRVLTEDRRDTGQKD